MERTSLVEIPMNFFFGLLAKYGDILSMWIDHMFVHVPCEVRR